MTAFTWSVRGFLAALCVGQLVSCVFAADGTAVPAPAVIRDSWKPDTAVWGDGLTSPVPTPQKLPYAFRNDYGVEIAATGWYELHLAGAGQGMRHDVFVDGSLAWRFGTTDAAGKAGNLWLTAGRHTIRLQRLGRVGYPARYFKQLELRPAQGRPEAAIQAVKTEVDVMRVGESYRIRVTGGGGGVAARYELLQTDLVRRTPPVMAGAVDFPASDTPVTRLVEIPCPAEGAFALTARTASGRVLSEPEFPVRDYAVVDVKQAVSGSGQADVVYDIDCVQQTVNGQPLPRGMFVEGNGPTRVTDGKPGRYRESHDCTPPEAIQPPTPLEEPAGYSGFSYRVDLPESQVPYLVEVDFPDDARRSTTVMLNPLDPKTGGFLKDAGYTGKSYETGGMFPLTNTMCKHRAITWPRSTSLLIGVMSQSPGFRAAAARIRVLRFKDDRLPLGTTPPAGGRTFVHWYEEAGSWRHLVGANDLQEGVVQDFVGLERWTQLARYSGASGLSAMGIGYQSAFYRAQQLDGVMPSTYDACRLLALLCEKYGMKYMPEVYCTQSFMENLTFRERTGNDDDFRAFNAHGGKMGTGEAPCTLNPLHPVVQENWIAGLGEMADKLRDSPAFSGITVRADIWGFRGQFTFPSIYWGYGDWTIRQFDKDTGLTTPGGPNDANAPAAGDPQRFLKRFAFLSSPDVRDRWTRWRADRILEYHQRLRDRIRGGRPDLFFAIAGGFDTDPLYRTADTMAERAMGNGVDLARRGAVDGLPILPIGSYGTRYTTAVDQARYDKLFDLENVHAGMGHPRMFSAYMVYQELARYWPAAQMGIKVEPNQKIPYYCSAVLGAGRHSLEKFAAVLAEQDTAIFRDGGNTDIFGDPELWRSWFNEFKSLPAVAFEPMAVARDPAAVWFKQVDGAGFYFYAVNREQYPVTLRLTLGNVSAPVTRLGTAEQINANDNTLVLELAPYELRSFRTALGTTLAGASTSVPPGAVQFVRDRMAYAQHLWQQLNGPLAGALTVEEMGQFKSHLDTAWAAIAQGHYWRARVTLSAAPMMRAYGKVGPQPDGQVVTRFPRLLQAVPRAGHWNLVESMQSAEKIAAGMKLDNTLRLVDSTTFNADWAGAKVLATDTDTLELTLDIPADGHYALHLGHVAHRAGVGMAQIDHQSLPIPVVTRQAGAPDTTIFPSLALKAGRVTLQISRPGGIGVYAMKLLPALRPMGDSAWAVAGPFPTSWQTDGESGEDEVKKTLERVFPPEEKSDPDSVYHTDDGREIRWTFPQPSAAQSEIWDRGVAMSMRVQSVGRDVNYGLTYVTSDRDRTALLYVAADWWARAYLNGERVFSDIEPAARDKHGADFTTFYPSFHAVLHLKKGVNTLMIKQHGGSMGSCFVGFLTDDPGIEFSVKPPVAGDASTTRQ